LTLVYLTMLTEAPHGEEESHEAEHAANTFVAQPVGH